MNTFKIDGSTMSSQKITDIRYHQELDLVEETPTPMRLIC